MKVSSISFLTFIVAFARSKIPSPVVKIDILSPIKNDLPELGLVFLNGADIYPSQYLDLMKEIQIQSNFSLTIALPEFKSNKPVPGPYSAAGVKQSIIELRKSGLSPQAPIVLSGHSIGAAASQEYGYDNNDIDAVVMMADTISRKRRADLYLTDLYFKPMMSIGGTMDGQYRIARMAEAFYHLHDTENFSPPSNKVRDYEKNFPLVLIEGLSHMQYATGDPPKTVYLNDYVPDIETEEAHNEIAKVMAAFFSVQFEKNSQSRSYLAAEIDRTRNIQGVNKKMVI